MSVLQPAGAGFQLSQIAPVTGIGNLTAVEGEDWGNLPPSALQVIASCCSASAFCTGRLVCRQWRDAFGLGLHELTLDLRKTSLQLFSTGRAFPKPACLQLLVPVEPYLRQSVDTCIPALLQNHRARRLTIKQVGHTPASQGTATVPIALGAWLVQILQGFACLEKLVLVPPMLFKDLSCDTGTLPLELLQVSKAKHVIVAGSDLADWQELEPAQIISIAKDAVLCTPTVSLRSDAALRHVLKEAQSLDMLTLVGQHRRVVLYEADRPGRSTSLGAAITHQIQYLTAQHSADTMASSVQELIQDLGLSCSVSALCLLWLHIQQPPNPVTRSQITLDLSQFPKLEHLLVTFPRELGPMMLRNVPFPVTIVNGRSLRTLLFEGNYWALDETFASDIVRVAPDLEHVELDRCLVSETEQLHCLGHFKTLQKLRFLKLNLGIRGYREVKNLASAMKLVGALLREHLPAAEVRLLWHNA